MADTRLYKVAITPCGKYVHGTEYDTLSLVLNATADGGDGCSYISLRKNKNIRPGTDDSVWKICLEKGEQGERGLPGSGFDDVEVSVDSSSGTPSAEAYIENDTFYLNFSGLKGGDGSDGLDGDRGLSVYTVDEDAAGFVPGQDNDDVTIYDQHRVGDIFIGQYGNVYVLSEIVSDQQANLEYQFCIKGEDGTPGADGQPGEDGVGFESIATPTITDGTALITLTDGNTITLDLNHQHTQYPKYVYCATQAAYDAITTKESDTLYLILESN